MTDGQIFTGQGRIVGPKAELLSEALNDPTLHISFRNVSMAVIYTTRMMAAVDCTHPVLVVPLELEAQFLGESPIQFPNYDGPLPVDGRLTSFGIVTPGQPAPDTKETPHA